MRQMELRFLDRGGKRRGGARRGAGRKPAGPRAGVNHLRRPKLSKHHPVHVTIRVVREVGSLRRRTAYRCVSDALLSGFPREGFRVVAVSVQATHIHLLIEADDERALARGMQGFEISFARRLNRRCKRKGRVLADRYHAEIITTPRQARNAYAYVFNNWRKHREDVGVRWRIDPFSSGIAFDGWKGMEDFAGFRLPPTYEVLPVHYPTVWLLTTGWRRYGRIDVRERPGPR